MTFFSGENMTGGYGGADIISSCTITVNRGEIVAILGPNGAGKSTAMKAMLGLLNLKSGKVIIDGKDISNLTPQDRVKEGIAFVPQTRNVFTGLSVQENLEMGAYLREERFEEIIEEIYGKKKDTVNILTHCNAGWLATIDWGTATSPIYQAHKKGIKVHVWVDETRPRNQGANLTSYELNEEGVPNTIIADNAGGILMQRGEVDMCIVGTDRTIATGDVANKIGTYLKALAAKDNNVPFYVALPSSTIDWETTDLKKIPIEERNSEELSYVEGLDENNNVKKVLIYPKKSKTMNLAFDITPAKYVTGLITEKGVCEASADGLKKLFK